ncbi:hypothetical protein D3C81_1355320 [compost metagenome]
MQLNACQTTGLVQSCQGSADYARRIARQDEQTDTLFVLGAGSAGGDDQQVGRGAIDDLCVLAVKGPASRAGLGHGLHAASFQPWNTGEGQGSASLTGGNRPQPMFLHALVVTQQQGRSGQARRGEQRRTQQVATALFQQDRQFDKSQAHAAKALGHHQRRPVQLLSDPPPDFGVMRVRAAHRGAHSMRVAGLGEKALGAVANHQVFFGKSELHGGGLCKADGCAKSERVGAVFESLKRTRDTASSCFAL